MSKSKGKKTKKRIIIFGGLAILIVAVLVLVLTSGNKEKIISVQTELAQKRTITQVVDATGKIHPYFQVELRPEVTGEIVELPVIEGQHVKKNQLLIRIKPEQYEARRNRAKAQLESAKANLRVDEATLAQVEAEYNRVKGLYEKGLASEKELETAKANYDGSVGRVEGSKAQVLQAEENYKDAEVELAKTEIYSPIDGKVTQLNVELSERVLGSSFSQGTHLMTVADIDDMEARVDVDENDVVLVSLGDTARVEIDAFGDRKFLGIVSQIGNSAQATGAGTQNEVVNFEVRIKLLELDQKIRSGMSCDATIETETKLDVVSVPIQSVTARQPKTSAADSSKENTAEANMMGGKAKEPIEVVFIADNGAAKMIPVKTGISNDTFIEITEGLSDSSNVISGPYRAISRELEDGTKIMVPSKMKSGTTGSTNETKVAEK